MHMCVSVTKNIKTKPETNAINVINVNWTFFSIFFNSAFRYFGFVSVFRFRFGKSSYPTKKGNLLFRTLAIPKCSFRSFWR